MCDSVALNSPTKIRVTARSIDELNVIIPIQLEAMKEMHEKLNVNNERIINNCTDKIKMKKCQKDENTIIEKKQTAGTRVRNERKQPFQENNVIVKKNEKVGEKNI